MKILFVDVASYGDQHTTLLSFKTDGAGGGEKLSRDMGLHQQIAHVAAEARKYNYVCIDERGVGVAFVDELRRMGLTNVLAGHSMRPL